MSASSLPLPQGKSVSLKQFVSHHINEIGLLVVIAILYLVFSLNAPGFISLNNQMNVLRDAATIGIAAWAMTLIIISGEIDVSVGPMVAFVSVCLAFLLQFEVPLAIACLLVLLLGALMGTLAGVLRGVFNVPSFVATLGLWSALRGMGLFMTNALPVPIDENEVLDWLGGQFLGVPVSALIMMVLFALFVFISRKTAFGRSVFAVGGNATAAQLCGINVRRVRILIFTLSGLLAAVTGILLAARLGSGNAGAANGLEFDVIAAVVVGGTALSGGRGSLFGTLLGVLVITLIGNGLVLLGINSFFQRLNQVEQSNQQRAALAQTRAVMLQASTTLNKAGTLTALSYPADDIKTLMTTARASLTQSTTLFKSFMAMTAGNEHVRALQKETEKSFARWHNDLEHQATWLESNQLSDFLTAPVQGSQNAFDVNFEAWQLEIIHVLEAASAQSQRNYQISALVFISMIIVAAIYISSALWWTRKMIVQPLAIIGSHFDSIAAGNLARPIAVYGRNEITAIFASLKTMQQALRGTVSDVRKGSQEMHIGIAEIVAGNNDLSSRTEQQAASLAQTAASMEQLTATVGQNADNARQASELAKNAATTAQAGGVQVSTMTHTMQEIATSSQKIGDIISVIDGIAFQTNILALNAAVEAARAGEQGRGFAVVAGEVRNLASRSAQAAKEIKGLIEESVNRVQQGSKLVNNAAATMTDIVSSVTRVNDIMGEIASASEEQRRGIEQVAQAVSQMDQVTQQN
ncbi:methyl-accepting chemotaxis protein IV, partial [Escherichia coli]|uniref:methyl-accepting chemotaxis protein IV n=1 Tax=Escherichia coli TaxID=562 RepID=UPI003F49858D